MHSKTCFTAAALVAALVPASLASADDYQWNNVGTGDYNDGANWDNVTAVTTGTVPTGGGGNFAYINNGGTAEIDAAIPDIQDLFVASGRNGDVNPTGTLNLNAGSVFGGSDSWGFVGEDGGTGTINITDTGVWDKPRLYVGRNTGGFAGDPALGGTGTINMDGFSAIINTFFILGEGAGATGTANITGDAFIQTSSEIWVSNAGGSATLNADSGTIEANTWIAIGRDSGTGVVNASGSVHLHKVGQGTDGNIVIGGLGTGGKGTLNITDNAIVESDTVILMNETVGQRAVINQMGGTLIAADRAAPTFQTQFGTASMVLGFAGIAEDDPSPNEPGAVYHISAGTANLGTIWIPAPTAGFGGGVLQQSGGTLNTTLLDQDAGTVRPGASAGTLHLVGGDYDMSGGVLEIEIGGTTAGSQHDQVIVDGAITITGGSLVTSIINGFSAAVGQQFDVMDFTSLTGTFDSIVGTPGAGLAWDDSLLYTDGILSVVAGGLPGDTNGDGDVDNADLQTAISNFTGPQTNPPTFTKTVAQGDNNSDGAVSNVDLQTAISNFTGPIGPAPVPEPASLALLGLGGLLIARRRRA